MSDHKESWKNEDVFKMQLELNKRELNGPLPGHWKIFLQMIEYLKSIQAVETFLDVGCGCGAFSELLRIRFPSIYYTGMDYAKEAIKTATEAWPYSKIIEEFGDPKKYSYPRFIRKNYTELTPGDVKNFDVVSSCGLHQILPNGDEAIETFLKLDAKVLIFLKLDLTDKDSYFNLYKAYDVIDTYEYFHNYAKLWEMFKGYGYMAEEFKQTHQTSHFLLRKQ